MKCVWCGGVGEVTRPAIGWNCLQRAYLGWERTGWGQRVPPRWCRLNTGCRWRERVWGAGVECCCLNRLILLGLAEPAGRGTWSGRSGRIKCCLEIAQGVGRGGKDRAGTTHRREQRHTQRDTQTDKTPVSQDIYTDKPPSHTTTHTEKHTGGESSQNFFKAPNLLQRTPTCT